MLAAAGGFAGGRRFPDGDAMMKREQLRLLLRFSKLAAHMAQINHGGGAATADGTPVQAVIVKALTEITTLKRPGKTPYAYFADGEKYIQFQKLPDGAFFCRGASMVTPSLRDVLVPERLGALAALGWTMDPDDGTFIQFFQPETEIPRVATVIEQTLAVAYDADVSSLRVETRWMDDGP